MDALEYLKSARLAPNGELLDKTEKLALLLLALELDEGDDSARPDVDRLADSCLVNRRSMFRILDALERKRGVRAIPQRTPAGQSAPTKYQLLDDKGRVLRATPSGAGRVLPDVGEGVTERGQSVTGNTLESVTGDTLPPHLKPNVSNVLRPAAFGTALAPPNTPNILIGERLGESVTGNTLPAGGLAQTDAVRLWFEIIGTPNNLPLNPTEIKFITSRVTNLPAWRYTLEGWAVSKWRKDNITGMVERYETKTLCLPQFQAPPPSSPASRQKAQEEEAAKEGYGKLMYGDQ